MRRIAMFVLFSVLAAASAASARTVPAVTGGATNVVPGLNVTVNALVEDTAYTSGPITEGLKGKINYDYSVDGTHFIGDVICLNIDGNEAVVVAQNKKDEADFLVVRVADNEATETPDRISVQDPVSESAALTHCSTPTGAALPVADGNFQVRPAE